jgi:hypothetical protein
MCPVLNVLTGKASIPLCCETTFTPIMSRPNAVIDRGMKLTASSESTPLLFRTFLMQELRQTRSLFKDGSKSAELPFEGSSVFDYDEDKGWGYRTSQITSIFTLEAMAISKSLTCIKKHIYKTVTLVYS